jgi:hypothetical protein
VTLATNAFEAAGIAIADFNGDSKPDIVVANFGSATESVVPWKWRMGVLERHLEPRR